MKAPYWKEHLRATLARGGESHDDLMVVVSDRAYLRLEAEAEELRKLRHPVTGKKLESVSVQSWFDVHDVTDKILVGHDEFDDPWELLASTTTVSLAPTVRLEEPKRSEMHELYVTDSYWLLKFRIKHVDDYTYETKPHWWPREGSEDAE